MTRSLPYLPAMFASCMLFQTLYVLCVAMWLAFPDLSGHLLLTSIFPQFRLRPAELRLRPDPQCYVRMVRSGRLRVFLQFVVRVPPPRGRQNSVAWNAITVDQGREHRDGLTE